MLTKEFVSKLLDVIKGNGVHIEHITYETTKEDYHWWESIEETDLRNYDDSDYAGIDTLRIGFGYPMFSASFEEEIFTEHLTEQYSDITLDFESGLAYCNFSSPFKKEESDDFEFFVSEIDDINCYADVSDLEGYWEKRGELETTCLDNYGYDDFARNILDYALTLYPLAADFDLEDFKDEEWFHELFTDTLIDSYIEDDSFVFCHEIDRETLVSVQDETGIDLEEIENKTEIHTIPFGCMELYLAMPLKDYNLVQLANIIWLQKERNEWSDNNLIFVSRSGYYVVANDQNGVIIEALDNGQILSHKTLTNLTKTIAQSDSSWWGNWQQFTQCLSLIPGCEEIGNMYSYKDKYSYAAKQVFYHFVEYHPELCTIRTSFELLIDSSVKQDKQGTIPHNYDNPLKKTIDGLTIDINFWEVAKIQSSLEYGGWHNQFLYNLRYFVQRKLDQFKA